jgi:hypothetical protein
MHLYLIDTLKAQTVIEVRSSQAVVPVTVTCRAEERNIPAYQALKKRY